MKRLLIAFLLISLLLVQAVAVSALTANEAKDDWKDAKEDSLDAQALHQAAKTEYAGDPSEENEDDLIEAGKTVLNAALDEVEAWLIWKDLEAEENNDVPEDLKDAIQEDVEDNLAVIDELREDVDGVDTQFELAVVFLKMIGKYFELLADVAQNSGLVWVHIGETYADDVEDYEIGLREQAEDLDDNEEIIDLLDEADDELEEARENIQDAEEAYNEIETSGQPLVKFAEGNNYLRTARTNLFSAHGYLEEAYREMVSRGD
ncbi:MAG: hypothetical protein ABIG93_00310 [archaeon]|nr:hypothetical protein [Nanoarchaeota archaeon]